MDWAQWKPSSGSGLAGGDAFAGRRLDATCASAANPCGLIVRANTALLSESVAAVREANELARQAQDQQQEKSKPEKSALATARDQERFNALIKKSWAVAMAPLQQTLSMAFMLWMSGSGVHVFSIMTTLTCLMIAGQGLLNCLVPFRPLEQADPRLRSYLWTQKALTIVLALVPVGLAIRKCISMQFLPTTEADFVGLLPLYSYDRTLGITLR